MNIQWKLKNQIIFRAEPSKFPLTFNTILKHIDAWYTQSSMVYMDQKYRKNSSCYFHRYLDTLELMCNDHVKKSNTLSWSGAMAKGNTNSISHFLNPASDYMLRRKLRSLTSCLLLRNHHSWTSCQIHV